MIEIKITLEHTPENLELLLAAAKAAQPAKEETKKEEEPKKPAKKPAKKEEEPKTKTAAKKEEAPKAKEAAKEEAPKTKNDIRYLALALTKDGKEDKIAEVFAEFGASRLSEIKEEDFQAVYEKLVVFDE